MTSIPVKLGVQQRVLPAYRAPFFEALAAACPQGLSVFAGQPRPQEALGEQAVLQLAQTYPAKNVHLLGGALYFCYQSNLVQWLEEWQPEILIMEANPRYLSTKQAVNWMHAKRRPVFGWGLGAPAVNGLFAGQRRKQRNAFLAQFDALLTYSQRGKDQYVRAGFRPERIFVAPNAAAPKPAHALPQRPVDFLDGKPSVLFVGRLQPRKRIDSLLHACAALPADMQPNLWIVGEGGIRAELEQLAARVYPAAHFFGEKRGVELEPLWRAADLFVLPGTGGLALQQAMSFGLPVMAAEADGTQDDLVRPQNGWLLPPGDLHALTAALQDALSDAARLRSMGAESYRIASEEVNLEAMLGAFAHAVEVVW